MAAGVMAQCQIWKDWFSVPRTDPSGELYVGKGLQTGLFGWDASIRRGERRHSVDFILLGIFKL